MTLTTTTHVVHKNLGSDGVYKLTSFIQSPVCILKKENDDYLVTICSLLKVRRKECSGNGACAAADLCVCVCMSIHPKREERLHCEHACGHLFPQADAPSPTMVAGSLPRLCPLKKVGFKILLRSFCIYEAFGIITHIWWARK